MLIDRNPTPRRARRSRRSRTHRVTTPRPTPLATDRFKVQLRVGTGFAERLERARSLSGHGTRGRETALVLERALDTLMARLERVRFGMGATARRRRTRG